MDAVELVVLGEADWTRAWLDATLRNDGFRVDWETPSTGTARRGDRIDGWLLGPRSRWLQLGLRLVPAAGGAPGSPLTSIRIERLGPPSRPGRSWDAAVAEVADRVTAAFRDNDRLASSTR